MYAYAHQGMQAHAMNLKIFKYTHVYQIAYSMDKCIHRLVYVLTERPVSLFLAYSVSCKLDYSLQKDLYMLSKHTFTCSL